MNKFHRAMLDAMKNGAPANKEASTNELIWLAVAWAVAVSIEQGVIPISTAHCVPLNYTAKKLLEAHGRKAELRAGFCVFSTGKGQADLLSYGNTHMTDRIARKLRVTKHATIGPGIDAHVWLLVDREVVDFSTFQIKYSMMASNDTFPVRGALGTWPPFIAAARDFYERSSPGKMGEGKAFARHVPDVAAAIEWLLQRDPLMLDIENYARRRFDLLRQENVRTMSQPATATVA